MSAGYAAGRLGSDTFAHRIDLAYRAGSRADLDALTADLSGRLRVVAGRLLTALRSPTAAPSAHVRAPCVWLTPPDAGEGPWVIGRDAECELIVDDMTVSRRHAELRWTPEGYALSDLNSTNGCYVNGLRMSSVLLRSGDHLVLGQVQVRLSQRP